MAATNRPGREPALNACRTIWGEDSNSSTHESSEDASITSDNDSIEEDSGSSDDEDEPDEPQQGSLLLSHDRTEEWFETPRVVTRREAAHNIVDSNMGPTAECKRKVISVEATFRLFFIDCMIEMIVKHTNEEGCRRHNQNWTCTDSAEIRRYIGVILLAGVFRSSNESIFSRVQRMVGLCFKIS